MNKPIVLFAFRGRSDVILATRAWNLRGPVKILKQAAGSCFCIFIYIQRNASFFDNPKLFNLRTVRMLLASVFLHTFSVFFYIFNTFSTVFHNAHNDQ